MPNPGGIQYDERGRPFIWLGNRRVYISPVAMGEKRPDDTTGIFRKGPQWNQYSGKWDTPIDWGNLLNIGVGAGLGAGAASAAGLFGGGAGAVPSAGTSAGTGGGASAAGTAAAGALPGMSWLPEWAYTANVTPAAITSQGVSRGIPWGGIVRGAGTVLGDGRNVADIAKQFNPWQQAALAALAGLPALLANKGPSAEERAVMEQARQMALLQQKRIEHQNPLFQAVTQLAMSRLPTANQRMLSSL